MPNPVFSKAGVPSVQFSQAPLWPFVQPYRPRQRRAVNDNGTVQVATLGPVDRYVQLRFADLPQSDYDALLAFFQHPAINWSAYTFLYTSHDATAYTVRLWDSDFSPSYVAPDAYDIELTLHIED